MDTAKIFKSGRSQAVQIPQKYQLPGKKVQISRRGNKLILNPLPASITLEEFFALPCCPDFEIDRSAVQKVQEREFFK